MDGSGSILRPFWFSDWRHSDGRQEFAIVLQNFLLPPLFPYRTDLLSLDYSLRGVDPDCRPCNYAAFELRNSSAARFRHLFLFFVFAKCFPRDVFWPSGRLVWALVVPR